MATTAATAAKAPHQQDPHPNHQGEENDVRQHLLSPLIDRLVDVGEVVRLGHGLQVFEVRVSRGYVQPVVSSLVHGFEQALFLLPFFQRLAHFVFQVNTGALPIKDQALHLSVFNFLLEFYPLDLPAALAGIEHEHGQQHDANDPINPIEIHGGLVASSAV